MISKSKDKLQGYRLSTDNEHQKIIAEYKRYFKKEYIIAFTCSITLTCLALMQIVLSLVCNNSKMLWLGYVEIIAVIITCLLICFKDLRLYIDIKLRNYKMLPVRVAYSIVNPDNEQVVIKTDTDEICSDKFTVDRLLVGVIPVIITNNKYYKLLGIKGL